MIQVVVRNSFRHVHALHITKEDGSREGLGQKIIVDKIARM